MVCKDTLRIKHLPKELTDAQKEDFIRHFGAIKVKVITSKAKAKSVVYAKFDNDDVAKNVLVRLHQITILNCRLSVEYAETDILQGHLTAQKVNDIRDGPDQRFFKNFINNINAFNDSVGFYQPPPSHLKYSYPKANRPTINNIAHALATVPRFYTQVLHLMNKMNLPPPFAMPEPPVRTIPGAQAVQNPLTVAEKRKAPSSSESEMESDGETEKNKEIIPQKRPVAQKKTVKRPKFIKQPVAPPVHAPSKPVETAENVFEKVKMLQPQRKIVIQEPVNEKPQVVRVSPDRTITNEVISTTKAREATKPAIVKEEEKTKENLNEEKVTKEFEIKESPVKENIVESQQDISHKEPQRVETSSNDQAEVISSIPDTIMLEPDKQEIQQQITENPKEIPSQIPQETSSEIPAEPASPEDDFPCISLEELAANQITDLSVMPVFKNYKTGDPTNKLYIKNCAKTVVVQDLEYIYNRYREESTEGKPSEFNIRLMQEGRMKGQAFVTLDSVEQAQKAVKETNGFILKDKPLVVVFGKAGKKK